MVTAVPAHTVWFCPPDTEGKALTVTVCAEDVAEHPAPLVTVTVYVPLELTERLGVVAPFDHK
jgi:hypothetical protein